MFLHRTPFFRGLAAALCLAVPALPAAAVQTDAAVPCTLSPADFGDDLRGICITSVPGGGSLLLGDRRIRSGDVLTAAQLEGLTFTPADAEADTTASMRYLPVDPTGIGAEAELVISIRGRRNDPPAAEDSDLETYKNLPNEGLLAVTDPEGDALTYTLVRSPRRGEVILRDDGSFLYTPDRNKVGTDSFTYTASDPAGNVSREATVTIEIRKPTDDRQYADTAASDCRFEAEWLRSTGVFSGETISGQLCFQPEREVSRGQFLAMLMQVLDLPVDRNAEETGFLDEAPRWLKPYLAAALRSGIISGYPAGTGVEFRPEQAVCADEAAIMVRNAMHFAIPAASMDGETEEPLLISSDTQVLTRSDAAKALYQLSKLRKKNSFFGLFR